ncbi:MAG: 16S rRNA (guanine(527)-N(7))-methyltransferase RsmG [Methylobacterium mesophilicum]|nr:16S rRNA (guanine(527)-N(7))-methyltransferase RsmG [Methylobacterium mesophilicum]
MNAIPDWLDGVSRETRERLIEFELRFREAAGRMNLVAPSTLDEIWERHFRDSLQLADLKPDSERWIDLGSGGGFPGIVLAIMLKEQPDGHIDLVESTGKKANFLRETADAMALPASVWNERIEAVNTMIAVPEIVTARALASLTKLLELSAPWLRKGAVGLFPKGRNYRAEIEESRALWRFDVVEHPSRTDLESAILEIRNLQPVRQR